MSRVSTLSRLSGSLVLCTAAWGYAWSQGESTRHTADTSSDPSSVARAQPRHDPIRYDRDIRPILSDRCFRCHGPDGGKREAKLRLDSFETATAARAGLAAITPGDPEQSELWRRITDPDPEVRMPPVQSHKQRLSADECATLRRWISEGAQYEPHWAFVAPARPELPSVRDASWTANEIDRFVLARLERESITPSPAAERDVLLRRVFLDLTGLPPTPAEIDAFLTDSRPDAYERQVDALLTHEPYRSRHAERMATPWLDAARYADTCGIHTDAGRSIWPWRDWVLRALRDDVSFDRFLTEQLAGDLLPSATTDQKIASGFNRNHVTTDEGGAIAGEALVEYAVDRAATVSSVFLGLTMGCARCHDHKFDPISQSEFYSFYAFFNSVDEPGLYSQLPDPTRAFEPFLEVPTDAQSAELARLSTDLEVARRELSAPAPEEDALLQAFRTELTRTSGVSWVASSVRSAESSMGTALTLETDGSVSASGANPDVDEQRIALRTDATDLTLLALEALPVPRTSSGGTESADARVGRANNGNAVLTGVEAEVRSLADPTQTRTVSFAWAWADREQDDGDYSVTNALDAHDDRGWAVDGHRVGGGRVALLLADAPFGYPGGSDIVVRLDYRSVYAQHAFARVRLTLGRIARTELDRLPVAAGRWYLAGPFPADSGTAAFATEFGPESSTAIDRAQNFGFGNQTWRHDPALVDGRLNGELPQGQSATYVGRDVYVPSQRTIEASLGSDDGFRLYVDGVEVKSRAVDRGLAADQDRVALELSAGHHALALKIVNTGGQAGFYWRFLSSANGLDGDLVAALLPQSALAPELERHIETAWRTQFSPHYRARAERVHALDVALADVRSKVARTMVMKELDTPRPTFVLTRGQYDHPDANRPVTRGVPRSLGVLPAGAPADRLGLAQWMTSNSNPLVARVAVNRLWEMIFGTGLVRTSEDFGLQGEWPSHPELLDWLAVEFRESGWSVSAMLRRLVTSNTYRQSSRARPELAERDPENRWLAHFPRRRLGAEEIRDGALYVSGLLVERFGGPSVKPYQPMGLWEEVAMPASNTRLFAPGIGDDLWRRSLYTYWKRASPPPALMTLDAPTRESCTIRRPITNTPLQALALWNDVQIVEAARAFAKRALTGTQSDRERLADMFRRATGRTPDARDLDALTDALTDFRARYTAAPLDAEALIAHGESEPALGFAAPELAAWTLIANALLALDATLTHG